MTPDARIDRPCLDCGASLADYNGNTKRCKSCSNARRYLQIAAAERRRRPVTTRQIAEYLAANAPKMYQIIVAKIREGR